MDTPNTRRAQAGNRRILLVDDEHAITELLKLILEQSGYLAERVDNGVDAIRISKETSFDLVLCDVFMPGIDGYEAMERIIEYKPTQRFCFVTGYAEVPGMCCLPKPFEPEELLDRVRTLLSASEHDWLSWLLSFYRQHVVLRHRESEHRRKLFLALSRAYQKDAPSEAFSFLKLAGLTALPIETMKLNP